MIRNTHGFTIIEGLLIVVAIGIIGGVGYMAYTNLMPHHDNSSATATVSPAASPATTPVVVKNSSDLDTVDKQLDALPLDDSDSSQLDSSTNTF